MLREFMEEGFFPFGYGGHSCIGKNLAQVLEYPYPLNIFYCNVLAEYVLLQCPCWLNVVSWNIPAGLVFCTGMSLQELVMMLLVMTVIRHKVVPAPGSTPPEFNTTNSEQILGTEKPFFPF
jgi:hypothetical protein